VVITAPLTVGLPTTPHATVGTISHAAVSASGNGPIATRTSNVAIAAHVLDLAVGVHFF